MKTIDHAYRIERTYSCITKKYSLGSYGYILQMRDLLSQCRRNLNIRLKREVYVGIAVPKTPINRKIFTKMIPFSNPVY